MQDLIPSIVMNDTTLFNNTKIAFSLKSDVALERAYFLFKMIANAPLVKIGTLFTNLALDMHLPVEGLIRATVFDHFCGGVTAQDCMPVIDTMYTKGVCSVLDYSVEGKEEEIQFDATMHKIVDIIDFVAEKQAIPFGVFKPTGLGRFALWQKKSEGSKFTTDEQEEWKRIEIRFDTICKKAHASNITLLIDAEESWIQDAADMLVLDMMRKYNTKKAIVFNTIQLYRHDRLAYLKNTHKIAKTEGFMVGVKIVRGAYLEKERERAEENGYPSPICKDKTTTDAVFNEALVYCIANMLDIAVFIGTHNEESSYTAIGLLQKYSIAPNDSKIWFGQLYGMSDHISFNLAAQGYNVAKYLPFGPVRDVMPYLIRRAEENTSVAGQTTRELALLKEEKKRRKL